MQTDRQALILGMLAGYLAGVMLALLFMPPRVVRFVVYEPGVGRQADRVTEPAGDAEGIA